MPYPRLSSTSSTRMVSKRDSPRHYGGAKSQMHAFDGYDSDDIDDVSLYFAKSGDHAWSSASLSAAEGLNDPQHDAMMDDAIKRGQDQILKNYHKGHPTSQPLRSNSQSPRPAFNARSRSPSLSRVDNSSEAHVDRQDGRYAQSDKHWLGKVKISKPDNVAVPDKKVTQPGIFAISKEEQYGIVDFVELGDPLRFTNNNILPHFAPDGASQARVRDSKADLQLDTAAVSEPKVSASLDKVSAYTDTSPENASATEKRGVSQDGTTQKPYNKRHLELDYDSPILAHVSLKDLQDAPYDKDPRSKSFQFPSPDAQKITTLPEKLNMLLAHSRDDRMPFFHSITMAEWEECGDWLTKRFANLMSQLKDGRKARRQLACGFEMEVRMQHENIAREKKDLENKIQMMRTGGIGVMQSSGSTQTPEELR